MAERLNLSASLGVAVREFPVESGFADYVLFVDRKAVGVIEAKPVGTTLSGVAEQSEAYITSFPAHIPHVQLPLPFAYESTGIETFFRLITYIHQNPQKHGFVNDFRVWPYSSYHAVLSEKATHLKREEVLAWFAGPAAFQVSHQQEVSEHLLGPLVPDDFD